MSYVLITIYYGLLFIQYSIFKTDTGKMNENGLFLIRLRHFKFNEKSKLRVWRISFLTGFPEDFWKSLKKIKK